MVSRRLQTARGSRREGPVLTENGENNSCSEEHVSSVVAQRSRERKGQKGHLSKVLTSAEKLLRFGVGGNKLLSWFNQVIYPHSSKMTLCAIPMCRKFLPCTMRTGSYWRRWFFLGNLKLFDLPDFHRPIFPTLRS